jgi:hypothetical protein
VVTKPQENEKGQKNWKKKIRKKKKRRKTPEKKDGHPRKPLRGHASGPITSGQGRFR